MRNQLIEITAWGGVILTIITPENISMVAGAASLALSTTGIILNFIKIYKNSKNKQNEKTY